MTGVLRGHHVPCKATSRLRGGATVACLLAATVLCMPPARAETLDQALANAYLINPALNAERARLRATDEQVAVAKSGLRPNISASGDVSFQNSESDVAGGTSVLDAKMRRGHGGG